MRNSQNPKPGVVTILGFSPIFGLFSEGDAEDQGPAVCGRPNLRRVVFRGETLSRVRLVFHELDGFTPAVVKAVNAIIAAGAIEPTETPEACEHFRQHKSACFAFAPNPRRKP